jgi:alpha-beta hydrolase superfamily lysophospholipase
VLTEEKFELALERLRATERTSQRIPVVLLHGFFVNSRFLNLGEKQSLAQFLARDGFDVWNLSLRGTGRSLSPLRGGSRAWSLEDIIDQDLPAVVRYIQQQTKSQKLFWVGFELGGLLAYGYGQKHRGKGLAAGVALAAPTTFTHPRQQPLKKLLSLADTPWLRDLFLYLNGPLVGRLLLASAPPLERFFYNPENMTDETKEALLAEALSEINPGILDHLVTMIRKGEFVSLGGTHSYYKNLKAIRLPMLLVGGEADPIAPPEAIHDVYRALGSPNRSVKIFGPSSKHSISYGHFDLIAGKQAPKEVFPVIAAWLKQRERQN